MINQFSKSLVLLLILPFSLFAQKNDSLAFTKIDWKINPIDGGAQLFIAHTTDSSLFNSKQHIMYIELKNKKNTASLGIAYDKQKLISTSGFAQKQGAIAAINGTFFDMKNGGSVAYLRVNDSLINDNRITNNKRTFYQKSAIAINKNKLSIHKWDGTDNWEHGLQGSDVMTAGPLLLLNYKNQVLDSISFNKNRHPRSAIGIRPDGTVIILAVDGRNTNSYGMSLFELSSVMKWLGCADALNLDGGGSTTLWIKNKEENGVVNYPSDNKKWDHQGERKVANIIFLKSKGK